MAADQFGSTDIVAALTRMLLARQITRFETNFEAVRRFGAAPEVVVWIRAQDDLSIARTRRLVRGAVGPVSKRLKVIVCPEPAVAG